MDKSSKSFAITVPMNNNKKSKESANRPIGHIYAESKVKETNLEYQQLLIRNK